MTVLNNVKVGGRNAGTTSNGDRDRSTGSANWNGNSDLTIVVDRERCRRSVEGNIRSAGEAGAADRDATANRATGRCERSNNDLGRFCHRCGAGCSTTCKVGNRVRIVACRNVERTDTAVWFGSAGSTHGNRTIAAEAGSIGR